MQNIVEYTSMLVGYRVGGGGCVIAGHTLEKLSSINICQH